MNFEFLDFKNGFVVKIYHTGRDLNDLDVLGSIKGVNNLVNVNKAELSIFHLLQKFQNNLGNKMFQILPKWLWRMNETAEAKGCLTFVLARMLLSIIAAPFIVIYMVIGTLLFIFALIALTVNTGRYSLPEGLYKIMRSG